MSSPIDAGRTQVALLEASAQEQRIECVAPLFENHAELWVKGAGEALSAASAALSAASAALDGDVGRAEKWMKRAQLLATQVSEWRMPFLMCGADKAKAPLILMTCSEKRPDSESLGQWVDGEPAARTQAGAWACTEWLVRQQAATVNNDSCEGINRLIQVTLDYAGKLYPWDQLQILSLTLGGMANTPREWSPEEVSRAVAPNADQGGSSGPRSAECSGARSGVARGCAMLLRKADQ